MTILRPFFTFYGGKWRIAAKYPEPVHDIIVEPFAGSAGYSLRHAQARYVLLYEIDEIIYGTWHYLINASADEIRRLPLYDGTWETVDDLHLHQEARWLIGWWLNKGTERPMKSPSKWMRDGIRPKSQWGIEIRERLARQSEQIGHWRITLGDYTEALDLRATWFIDPPYEFAGRRYRYGADSIDYAQLAQWCQSRRGQVIVCENDGASWLPFVSFAEAKGTEGSKRNGITREAIWLKG